ncbi:hypothetical protein S58_13840 [Bradyrhizobium oligotrophicum S58]|uniref:Uncharacterized protein n=1 Tax=Bradyrhizobium oligotrophicum S58 TaxID=1245469 RepID=M4Z2F2_9BRAD|nr:hypothetical protein S58_13840 [Bradyrhizobium oligotrophicum S58]
MSAAIYLNFFTDHYGLDLRFVLFGWAALLFAPATVHFDVTVTVLDCTNLSRAERRRRGVEGWPTRRSVRKCPCPGRKRPNFAQAALGDRLLGIGVSPDANSHA